MRRRSVIVLWALALVAFPLVGNLATNSVNIPQRFSPWIWVGLAVLALFAGLQIYLDLLASRQQSNTGSDISTTTFRFLGGRIEINSQGIKLARWASRPLIIPWSEVRDIRVGIGDDWRGDYADAVALDSCLLAQPLPTSPLLTTNPGMSAYDSRLDMIHILNLERAGIPRHAAEAALSRHRPRR
jgi:hypothetical protein